MVRQELLPIGGIVPAGETITFKAMPQTEFLVEKVRIADIPFARGKIARTISRIPRIERWLSRRDDKARGRISIESIRVGNSEMMVGGGGIPIFVFMSEFSPTVLFDICRIGESITFVVKNASRRDFNFRAVLFGRRANLAHTGF